MVTFFASNFCKAIDPSAKTITPATIGIHRHSWSWQFPGFDLYSSIFFPDSMDLDAGSRTVYDDLVNILPEVS